MTTRTDIHRPSAIIPTEYQWIAFQYYGASDLGALLAMKVERERLAAHMAQTGGKYSNHEHGGCCHICGCANVSYASVFYHTLTNSYIVTGQDCAEKLDMSCGDWNRFRKTISNHLEAQAGKKKAAAVLEIKGLSKAWDIYSATGDARNNYRWEEVTVSDIVSKLVKYGSISDKQVAFIEKLLEKIPQREIVAAQRETEKAAAADCPTGRVEIKGTVLGLKVVETDFGTSTKILVQAETGYKVWGSRFDNVEKGAAVHFVASVQPSNDDPKFGFFKRPTVYVAPDAKKQLAKQRKLERDRSAAMSKLSVEDKAKIVEAIKTLNPNYYIADGNYYHPELGTLTPEQWAKIDQLIATL